MEQKTPKTKDYKISFKSCFDTLQQAGLVVNSLALEPSSVISKIQTNSKQVAKGDVFIAYRGIGNDGHRFIDSAIDAGATSIIFESSSHIPKQVGVNWIQVSDGRKAWSQLMALKYQNPQNQLHFIGITGTNGKTSTVWIIKEFYRALEIPFCSIGTLGIWINDEFRPSSHTTPDPNVFFPLLRELVEKGIETVIMEVSSHALTQGKLDPIKFDATGFTSFSRDHLDYHKDMDDYFNAKWLLFTKHLKENGFCFFNGNLPIESYQLESIKQDHYFYGYPNDRVEINDFEIHSLDAQENEISIQSKAHITNGRIPFKGQFNDENFCLALGVTQKTLGLEIPPSIWETLRQIPGRLQHTRIDSQDIDIYVDYAHTPDALKQVLLTLNYYKKPIAVVFGCGGDRDKGKRPEMAKVAEEFADTIIITSDNPRGEDPESILKEIKSGFSNKSHVESIIDRRAAIVKSIMEAPKNSIVLIAGKGHEQYQIIGDKTIDFDDFKIASAVIQERLANA